jgi:hypothetical protein
MQSNSVELWDKTKGPYGVRFEEVDQYKKGEQIQYKHDLEYLMKLKQGMHGDMTQKEWEAYNRKLHYMNDRYAYGELDKINFLRGMMKGYENESYIKKEDMKRRREKEIEEERKKLIDMEALYSVEKEKQKQKRAQLYNEQMIDLENFQRKKQANYIRDKQEEEKIVKNFPNYSDEWDLYPQMRDKLKNCNKRIYGNAFKYNNYIGEPIDPITFNAKSDLEFNKMIADQKERKKLAIKNNPYYTREALRIRKELEDDAKKKREINFNRQKLYKEYLDNQNNLGKLNKLKNINYDSRPQLIMPAYYYPNFPEPIYHKARDSLLASKQHEKFFGKNMNKFFSQDANMNTLLDYEEKTKYLGDSNLRHNPITCPVNDYYYNKYVNKLKKESEIVPVLKNSRSQILPRHCLYNFGNCNL